MAHSAHSTVCRTRSAFETPQMVEVTLGSRMENWSAAAPTGTPCRAQMPSIAFTGSKEVGLDIIEGLRGHTTGYGVPTYVVDAPGGGGKIPLIANVIQKQLLAIDNMPLGSAVAVSAMLIVGVAVGLLLHRRKG